MTQTSRRSLLLTALAVSLLPLALAAQTPVPVLTAPEALEKAKAGEILLVDIRTPDEWQETGLAEGSIGLDMTAESFVDDLTALRKANPDKPIALICRTGNRSGRVAGILTAKGFPGLADVSEGMVGGRNGPGWLPRNLPVYPASEVQARTRARLGQ